jgi:Zn-dependent M28 family amino/carboxypeptidase
LFAAWFGEEADHLGSISYLAKVGGESLRASVAAYVNLDLIGRLDRQVRLAGLGTSPAWPVEVERANAPLELSVLASRGMAGIGAADRFAGRGVLHRERHPGSVRGRMPPARPAWRSP